MFEICSAMKLKIDEGLSIGRIDLWVIMIQHICKESQCDVWTDAMSPVEVSRLSKIW